MSFRCFRLKAANLLLSASVACLFQNVTGALIHAGPTQLLLPQTNRCLKFKEQLITTTRLIVGMVTYSL